MTETASAEIPVPIQTHRPSARRLTLASAFNLAIKLLAAAMGVLVAALLARHLGPADYGNFTTALGMVAIAQALTEFGTNAVAVRDMAGQPERRSVIAGGLMAARLTTSLALLLPLVVGLVLLLPPGAPTIAGILIGSTLLLTAFAALQSVAQADLRPEVAGALLFLQSTVWLAMVALLVWIDAGIVAFAAAFALTAALQSVITILVMRRYVRISFDGWRREEWRILKTAVPMGLAGVLTTAYYRVDAILVYEIAGADQAGFYNAAYRYIDVLQILPATVYFVLFPLVAARRRAGADIRRVAGLAATLMIVCALPVVVVGVVFADPIVDLIYSSTFEDAALLMAVLSVAFVGISLGYLWTSILLAEGPLRVFLVVAAITAVGSIAANLLLIPSFGALGAAWITVGTELWVGVALGVAAVRRARLEVPWTRWALGLVAAGIMAACALILRPVNPWLALPVCIVVYAGAVLAVRAVRPSEVLALVRRDAVALAD